MFYKMKELIDELIEYRLRNLNETEINMLHVACVILKNKPYIFTHPYVNKSRLKYYCKGIRSVHSEIEAISNLPPRDRLKNKKNIDMIVIRITKTGVLTSSMPCEHCLKNMNEMDNGYKINNVYFSTNERIIEKVKLRDLMNYPKHISGGFMYNRRKRCKRMSPDSSDSSDVSDASESSYRRNISERRHP